MNNRDYKQFAPGECYHIYNRGVGKMDIFKDSEDYNFVLTRLREYLNPQIKTMGTIARPPRRKSFPSNSFSLICHCLMPNHFHFLIQQNGEVPISALMLNLWSGYVKYFNKKYERVGSLFQDQFKAILIDNNEYLTFLSAYIHLNPTTDGISARPEDYEFSSYREYIGLSSSLMCAKDIILGQFGDTHLYRQFVNESTDPIKNRKELRYFLISE